MLKYTGGGWGGAMPDIPARDLTDEEAEQYGALIAAALAAKLELSELSGGAALVATGLYEIVEAQHIVPQQEA